LCETVIKGYGCDLLSASLGSFSSQPNFKDRQICWRDSADSAGLAVGSRADTGEFLSCFGSKVGDEIEIKVGRDKSVLPCSRTLDLGFLSSDVPLVLDVGFQ